MFTNRHILEMIMRINEERKVYEIFNEVIDSCFLDWDGDNCVQQQQL
jgi:hypothetical protein